MRLRPRFLESWMSLIDNNFTTTYDFRKFQIINKSDLRDSEFDKEKLASYLHFLKGIRCKSPPRK